MKGGSMTLILLECLFWSAIKATSCLSILKSYNDAYIETYTQSHDIAKVMELAASRYFLTFNMMLYKMAIISLKEGGHIYYVGEDEGGVLGFIDASE
jgi:hypothetical protein